MTQSNNVEPNWPTMKKNIGTTKASVHHVTGYNMAVNECREAFTTWQSKQQRELENIRQILKNDCEQDKNIRAMAKKHLTEHEVEGDSYGVPMLEDIVELLIKKIETKQPKQLSVEEMTEIGNRILKGNWLLAEVIAEAIHNAQSPAILKVLSVEEINTIIINEFPRLDNFIGTNGIKTSYRISEAIHAAQRRSDE